jgi:hypothetical protein
MLAAMLSPLSLQPHRWYKPFEQAYCISWRNALIVERAAYDLIYTANILATLRTIETNVKNHTSFSSIEQ